MKTVFIVKICTINCQYIEKVGCAVSAGKIVLLSGLGKIALK